MKLMKVCYTVMLYTVFLKCDKTKRSNFSFYSDFFAVEYIKECDSLFLYFFLKRQKIVIQKEKETKLLYSLNPNLNHKGNL